ncbi:MAG: vacuolar ATPase assembly integral membrane protein vma21 [Ramalina farinacea]|uniref:Vacuolar ATPase assembly integral membrane protein vma21 n=1 Tax=Ramalina farinacea TaxID=258253 RepID=A0AA43QKZ9_9LECA|nr:vacuolar ATPase assembly integral membrane protein vma21 [Ramalina farinacea]
MTTRRNVLDGKSVLEKDDRKEDIPAASESSSISPAVPTIVIVKLLGFTAAMIIGPIGTYFLTLNTIFKGNSTWAGATAAVMANVVLIAYVIVAFRDDESDRLDEKTRIRKGQ